MAYELQLQEQRCLSEKQNLEFKQMRGQINCNLNKYQQSPNVTMIVNSQCQLTAHFAQLQCTIDN